MPRSTAPVRILSCSKAHVFFFFLKIKHRKMYRSVVEFETQDDLHNGLLAMKTAGTFNVEYSSLSRLSKSAKSDHHLQAIMNSYDSEMTEAQSLKQELCRLQTLKSYLILDAERERAFDRITEMAARLFHAPIALISLVDLGRQWFLSSSGLGDVRETCRGPHAFCAHAILSKQDLFIVPDATQDFRFKDSPMVTGEPNIRFYAGASLTSPEGYKLGTCCIIMDQARPQGLSDDEKATLKDLAAMAVEALLDRRNRLQLKNYTEQIAYEAHNLLTPLTGVQLTLSMLTEDEGLQQAISGHHMDMLTTASTSSDLMLGILKTMDGLRQGSTNTKTADLLENGKNAATNGQTQCGANHGSSDHESNGPSVVDNYEEDKVQLTNMVELVSCLNEVMEEFPKQVPLAIQLNSNVPKCIVADDLKLFRSAMNLLSAAVSRSTIGCIKLHIFADNKRLVFECTDKGTAIPEQDYDDLFLPSRAEDGDLKLCLWSVANLIDSMEGDYGFRPLREKDNRTQSNTTERQQPGSVFWFSIPLIVANASKDIGTLVPQTSSETQNDQPWARGDSRSNSKFKNFNPKLLCGIGGECFSNIFSIREQSSSARSETVTAVSPLATFSQTARQRRALVIDDSMVILKSMSMALRKLDYEVAQAENGLEGLEKLMVEPFDLVLCDFLMPVMDGLDCVKQFRSWEKLNRPGFQQLIVGISAHANENVAAQGLAAGMDDFRSKPLRITCLREICASEIVKSRSMKLDAFVQSMSNSINLKDKVFNVLDKKRGATDDCDVSPSDVPNDQRSKRQRTMTGNTT